MIGSKSVHVFFNRLFIYALQLEIQLSTEEDYDLLNMLNPATVLCLFVFSELSYDEMWFFVFLILTELMTINA